MIKVEINIGELPAEPGRRRGMIECKVISMNPTDEEVHVLARLFEKMREIGREIGEEKGGASNIVEFRKPKDDVRPEQSEGDRGTDQDRQPE